MLECAIVDSILSRSRPCQHIDLGDNDSPVSVRLEIYFMATTWPHDIIISQVLAVWPHSHVSKDVHSSNHVVSLHLGYGITIITCFFKVPLTHQVLDLAHHLGHLLHVISCFVHHRDSLICAMMPQNTTILRPLVNISVSINMKFLCVTVMVPLFTSSSRNLTRRAMLFVHGLYQGFLANVNAPVLSN